MKKWEQLQLTPDNSKSEESKVIIRIKHEIVQGNEILRYQI